jgi:hypothetical protein
VRRRVTYSPAPGVEMRIALVGVTGREPQLASWHDPLQRAGLPRVSLALVEERDRRILLAEMRRARFQALILADAGILEAALGAAACRELERLERAYRIRRLIAFAYPTAGIGLRPSGSSAPLDGVVVHLTPRGKELFPYLRPELTIDAGSWGHPAWPFGSAQFEPLLTTADGAALLGLHRQHDGREQMVQTFATNPLQTHTHLLRGGQLRWLTHGVHLGLERHYLSLHVDDVLLANPSWNVATHTSDHDPRNRIRMSADDATYSACWSRARGLRLDLVFNGAGTASYVAEQPDGRDPLLETLLAERTSFGWINHTYGHCDLDEAPRAVIEAEIGNNARWARDAGIELEPLSLVTGGHSGLANLAETPPHPHNPELAAALAAQNIQFIAGDASRPYPAGQAGCVPPGVPFQIGQALVIPRHPITLPFDAATARQALDRMGRLDGRREPDTWADFLADEVQRIFRLVLSNDPRPHYVHQSNLVRDADGRTLLHELVDAVLGRYRAALTETRIEQPRFDEIGALLLRLNAWRTALATGLITARVEGTRVRIDNRAHVPVAAPLTGTVVGSRYGGTRSGWGVAQPGTTMFDVEPQAARSVSASRSC